VEPQYIEGCVEEGWTVKVEFLSPVGLEISELYPKNSAGGDCTEETFFLSDRLKQKDHDRELRYHRFDVAEL
jgi:hypothetical protein